MVVPLAAGFCFVAGEWAGAGLSAGFFPFSDPVVDGLAAGFAGGAAGDKGGITSVGSSAGTADADDAPGFCAALCVEPRNNRLLPTTQNIATRAPRTGLRLVLGCMAMVFS